MSDFEKALSAIIEALEDGKETRYEDWDIFTELRD